MHCRTRVLSAAIFAATLCSAAFGQAQLTSTGYGENFNSMGTSGTTPPTGWRHLLVNSGSNSSWTSSIPASGMTSAATIAVTAAGTTLTATTTPSANSNNGFNAAAAAGTTADRVIATAPTTNAGTLIQLDLANQTGSALNAGSQITIAFDTIRYSSVSSANELPGYWVFFSLNGTTWTNVTPNPTITTVPNSAGTTSTSLTLALGSTWASGSVAYVRWIDDNAVQTSPDQIIGLNNVSISYVAATNDGRCCLADGSCTLTTTGSCTIGTFTPQGVCTPNTCPQPPQGACCTILGACSVTIQVACTSAWTNGGTCTPNPCSVLVTSLTASGYNENFDGLTPTGTALPTGYSFWTVPGDRPTFVDPTIPASGVSGGTQVSPPGVLAVYDQTGTNTPGTRNAGYNFGFSSDPSNRLLGVAPTGNGASFIQLRLVNDTNAPVNTLTINYTFRVMSPWLNNELAGFRFFYSTTGPSGSFTAFPALDGVALSTNLTGDAIAESATIALASPLQPGDDIVFRWADDNGSTSPDQAYAIDNLSVLPNAAGLQVCCASGGACTLIVSGGNCSGTIDQNATTCDPNPCPQPPSGTCCALDGSCLFVRQSSCSGVWTIGGACSPNPCPGPVVACCAADGTCIAVPQEQCTPAVGFNAGPQSCSTVALCRQPGTTRFVAFGDHGVDNTNQNSVAVRMKQYNPEFMVTTGDNTYFTSTAVSNWDTTQAKYYGEFIRVGNPASAYFAQFGNNVNRFFPCMGNHDFDVGGGAAGAIPSWNAFWDLPGNERYYTFSRGEIDFFILSSDGREPDSDLVGGIQHQWFVSAYAASTAKYKIVVFHHPPYTNPTTHGNDAQMQAWNFQNLPGITAVLNGHNHNMQRLELPRGGSGVGSTVPFFISGAGGNSLYSISGASPFNAFNNSTEFGFLMIDAAPGSITFRFISAAGNVLDTKTVVQPGACCLAGVCTVVTDAAACGSGTFQGAGVACSPSLCPPPTATLTVSASGIGSGSITSAPSGINCPGTCSADFPAGSIVSLTATPASNSRFTGWSGACAGVGTCFLVLNSATLVQANFRCAADQDGNGILQVSDIFLLLQQFFAGNLQADFNQSGGIEVSDIFAFLAAWFAGC